MRRVLTLDWDYFIDASAKFRLLNFPDTPNENYPRDLQNIIWTNRYHNSELGKVGVKRNELSGIAEIIKEIFKYGSVDVWVSDSHAYMYDIIAPSLADESFEVINFDFHHDLYPYSVGGEINCGNWCRVLMNNFPNMKYIWVRQEDSDTSLYGVGNFSDFSDLPNVYDCVGLKELINHYAYEEMGDFFKSFTEIHICKSGMWTPPHLDGLFTNFIHGKLGLEVDKIILIDANAPLIPRTINTELLLRERAMYENFNM